MTGLFAVTTVICAVGWAWTWMERDYYEEESNYRWRLYKEVVMQYVELSAQHIDLLLRRNT